jgi:DNA repair exonuclease SbcCD ATPase subunit
VNNQQIEQYRKILECKFPSNINHVGQVDGHFFLMTNSVGTIHNLADIQEIVEQAEQIAELKNYIDVCLDNSKEQLIKRIAELEKERDELNEKFEEYFDAFMNCKCIPRNMEAHNLEQQAKGVESLYEWFRETHTNENDRGFRYMAFVDKLRQQAKGGEL